MTDKSSYSPGEPTWVDLGTPDMDASIAFYSGLFGWSVERGGEEFGGYSTFLSGGKRVGGVGPLMAEGQPPVWSVYVCVEDADKTTALVEEAGGSVIVAPMTVGDLGRMAVYADSTGAAIGVWQPMAHTGAEVIDSEGTFTWSELSSRDQSTAHAFYGRVFGWEPQITPDYTEFQLGGTSVAGCMDTPEMVPAEVPSYWMPYFAAGNPAAKADEAAGLGATVLVPSTDFPGGTFSVVADPHGATFGLLRLNT